LISLFQAQTIEGLFRIPGNPSDLIAAFNEGKTGVLKVDKQWESDTEKINEIHNVASMIKAFFRKMPEPLFPFRFYDLFILADGG
jgi:hypothetical protein